MARSPLTDFLQVGRFHIIDVSFAIPMVLLPVYGFKSCTLPELSLNIRPVIEGNYEYARKVISGAEVSNITLEQGVSLFNSDFWDWTRKAVVGRKPAKNLLIVQFTRMGESANAFAPGDDVATLPSGTQIPGAFEFTKKIPGRAWLCRECRPARYKPGSDFDGMSQDISLASLELSMEEFEEFSLGV